MSVKVMSLVWEYSQAKGGDLLILLAIADHADDAGRAFPGEERLAKKARMTERNVRHCLQGLQTLGELSVAIQKGRGRSNHYQVNIGCLLSRAKEGNDFQENFTGNDFQEKFTWKNEALKMIKEEKSDRKTGNTFPPNHQLTISSIQTSENYYTEPATKSRESAPLSCQPGEIDEDLRIAILSLETSEFHGLANPTKLHERFWNAQIKLVDTRGLITIYAILQEVDAYYVTHPEKLPVNEKSARARMAFGIQFALEKAQGRRRYAGR